MTDQVLFTVGSVLRGDDAAGPLLAKLMEDGQPDGWTVVDGAQTPENDLAYLRRLAPQRIVVVDAAAMGLEPGEVRRLEASDVMREYLISTHTLPLSFLLEELHDVTDDVVFLGIQPQDTTFFAPLTPAVDRAVRTLYEQIVKGFDEHRYPAFCPAEAGS